MKQHPAELDLTSHATRVTSIFLATSDVTKLATVYDSSIRAFKHYNSDRDLIWTEDPDEADCIVLFEEWATRFWNYPQVLLADPFFTQHWRKILTVNCDSLGRGFLPGCYTSLTRRNFDRRLYRACAYPYTYNELTRNELARHPDQSPQWLFSFRGNLANLFIRKALFDHLSGEPDGHLVAVPTQFHKHSADQKRAYIADILNSKFVLCPKGQGPASYRMFEVMGLGRCPVIISDNWVPIEGVKWVDCAIFVKERDILQIPAILRSQEHHAAVLGQNARVAWVTHFSDRAKFRAMLDSIVEVHQGLRQEFFDYRARWNSWKFYRVNGWLPHQRLAARLGRKIAALKQ